MTTWGFRDNTPVDVSAIPDSRSYNPEMPVYTGEFKVKAALAYLLTCSMDHASDRVGITKATLQEWMRAEWWPTAVAAAREAFSDELVGDLSEIVRLAQTELRDRLVNGDVIAEKQEADGSVKQVRRPVKAKELAIIAAINFDKRQIATGQPTSVSKRYSTAAERADRMRGTVARKPASGSGDKVVPFGPVEKKA